MQSSPAHQHPVGAHTNLLSFNSGHTGPLLFHTSVRISAPIRSQDALLSPEVLWGLHPFMRLSLLTVKYFCNYHTMICH